ncbi:MAG: DUF2357 domain-containing protein [Candidatus Marinimicrobia bacterium]|nr:DUF2357 domain-containing protein [Candidatus Neomarinimicrobiota bacterium]
MRTDRSFLNYPWEINISDKSAEQKDFSAAFAWSSQVCIDLEAKVVNAATGRAFPEHQVGINEKIVEFPGPSLKGDMSKSLTVEFENSELVTLSFMNDEGQNNNLQMIDLFEAFFDSVMNGLLFFVRDCLHVEKFKVENTYWVEVLTNFDQKDDDDPAKYSLIVDLARPVELFAPLKRITDRPKRVLRRIHDQERIQKVQEVDTRCLIDLARRPGTLLVEKAGPKQRILAIKRQESIDILENKVAKHCCVLASLASKRYLREHEEKKYEVSPRKKSVSKLLRSSHQLPLKNSFHGVSNLIEPCRQPNYTLMQNADYYKVWKAYVQLVRNEDLRQELWKWNRRMWSEFLGIYLTHLMSGYQQLMTDSHIQPIGDKTVQGRRRHVSAKWLLSDTLPGPYIIDKNSDQPATLYLISGDWDTLEALSPALVSLAGLNADFLFISSKRGQLSVLPIYSIMPSNNLDQKKYPVFLEGIVPSLLNTFRCNKIESTDIDIIGAWVLLGNWANNVVDKDPSNTPGHISLWVTSVNPDYSFWKASSEDAFEPLMTICGV